MFTQATPLVAPKMVNFTPNDNVWTPFPTLLGLFNPYPQRVDGRTGVRWSYNQVSFVSSVQFCVVVAFCDEIYGRYCIQKSNNDHLHPQLTIIVFKIMFFIFCCLQSTNSTAISYIGRYVCPLRNHVTSRALIPSVLKRLQK